LATAPSVPEKREISQGKAIDQNDSRTQEGFLASLEMTTGNQRVRRD
jgi:hypothetical protein